MSPTVEQRYAFSVDRPADWQQPAHTLYVVGWCADRAGEQLRGVRAAIGWRRINARYGIRRDDVAAVLPEIPHAAHSGFAVAVSLRGKRQTLQLQLRDAAGTWRTFFEKEVHGAPASAGEAPPPDAAIFDEPPQLPSRFECCFERPHVWSECVRHLNLGGWCVARTGAPVSEMRARIRGRAYRANYGIMRPDVAATLGDRAGLRSGFSLDVVVPPGPATLVLEARSGEGAWEPILRHRVRGPLVFSLAPSQVEAVGDYADWIRRYDTFTGEDAARARELIAGFRSQPTIAILLPAYNTEARWLRRAIASVQAQVYPHWQLCIVDDASPQRHVWKIVEDAARRDPRIRIHRRLTNGHIAAASNDALQLGTGEFIGLLDHDDELAPAALFCVVHEVNKRTGLQLIYTDEDKLDRFGRRSDPYFKPDWNPDLFTAQNYISHFTVFAAELVRKVGGFRVGYEGSQDYDLTLRCIEQITPAQIAHIPHVLYHWRSTPESTASFTDAKPYAQEAARRAMQDHCDRSGLGAQVTAGYSGYLRLNYPPPAGEPRVSVIIPTRDRAELLRRCIGTLREKTSYANFEIIIVDNESREPETRSLLESLARENRVRVVRAVGEFNFSRVNNVGVTHARGDFLALLNNDTEVQDGNWLSEMLSHAARPEVGAVGARLWYPDGKLQHGGVLLGIGGVAQHAHTGLNRTDAGYFGRAHLTQNFSAVTAACMVLRRDLYEAVGGLDEAHLAVAFNDVDLCLRLRERGLRIVWAADAELIHHESASRGFEDTREKQQRVLGEVAYMRERWGAVLDEDPFYNPNLSTDNEQQWKLAFPPRVTKPWVDASP
jgi:O-antigen biosynthesis protein